MHRLATLAALLVASLAMGGCDLIGDVLEFGFWALIIFIAVVVLLIWLLMSAIRGRSRTGPPPPP